MNYFCWRSFRIYEQNLSKILIRRSSFWIGSYSEIYQQSFSKINSKKCIFKVGSFESISEILEKYPQKNLHFRKLFGIYEKNLWITHAEEFFVSVYQTLGYICDCLLCTIRKMFEIRSVNHLPETSCLFTWYIMKTK